MSDRLMSKTDDYLKEHGEPLDAADLAALIRRDLKNAYPGVAFSVKTSRYSGGSSVRAKWTDGPLEADVRRTIDLYCAQGFDGMTDSQTNRGAVMLPDGRKVRIYSFVFANREISPSLRARFDRWFARRRDYAAGDLTADPFYYRHLSRAVILNGCLVIRHDR